MSTDSRYFAFGTGSSYYSGYGMTSVQGASFYCANAPQEDRSCDFEKKMDCAARHGFFYCCAKYSLTSHGRNYLEDVYGDDDMDKINDFVDDYEYTCEIDPTYFDAQEWQTKTDGIYTYACSSSI